MKHKLSDVRPHLITHTANTEHDRSNAQTPSLQFVVNNKMQFPSVVVVVVDDDDILIINVIIHAQIKLLLEHCELTLSAMWSATSYQLPAHLRALETVAALRRH